MTGILGKFHELIKPSSKKFPKTRIQIPADLMNTDLIAVFSGTEEVDVWPAIYLANVIQKTLPNIPLVAICNLRDRELFSTLNWHPDYICYKDKYIHENKPDSKVITDRSILIHPLNHSDKSIKRYFRQSSAGVKIAGFRDLSVNIFVSIDSDIYPDYCLALSEILGLQPDSNWLPAIPHHHDARASTITAPSSGRMLPFIAISSCAKDLLNRFEVEMPMRTVILTGKNTEHPEIPREIRAAVVARASAVVTAEPNLWADACALGTPVIGYDPGGMFQNWHGRVPETTKSDFVNSWNEFLRAV